MKISAYLDEQRLEAICRETEICVEIPEEKEEAFLEIRFEREIWNKDEFLIFPGAVYNGNRYRTLYKNYPPMFTHEEAAVDMPITITDNTARLMPDGSGKIALESGSESVPCVGIWDKENKKAQFFFTVQQVKEKDTGLAYENGIVSVTVPHRRNDTFPQTPHNDRGTAFHKGEIVTVPVKVMEFACETMEAFYELLFQNRKCMGMDDTYSDVHGSEELFHVQEEKFNKLNFYEKLGTYTVGVVSDQDPNNPAGRFQVWQPGWVGGAMSSYPLMKLGSEESYKNGRSTLDFLFSTQMPSGFFKGIIGLNGEPYSDSFNVQDADDWHLLRKSADVLFFLFRHYEVMQEKGDVIPENYVEGTRKLADGFVRMWERYGQFGQFVSDETGDIIAGGSCSAAIASAALVGSYRFFKEEKYLTAAKESGDYYYRLFIKEGCTTGGPGEMLQCPDSESAFGLMESMMALYDETKDEKWLNCAKTVANYCATWVMPYNYKFPETSEFGRLNMKSVGSVFANAQNKHSAPGICTLSGDSIYRLYQACGDKRYLELIQDIACNVFQYISREDRTIYAKGWGGSAPTPTAPGYVNERVNTNDWEGEDRIGEIFYGSTWAETSALLTWAELRELVEKKN